MKVPAAALALILTALYCPAQQPLVQNGDSIAFLGDSITKMGADNPGGYVNLVISGLKTNGIAAKPRAAGISGNIAAQMLARLSKLLAEKPAWMTVSAGVNDSNREVTLEDYSKTVTAIVDQAQAANIKVLLMTASLLGEDPEKPKPKTIATYNEFLHKLAAERHLPIAEVNAEMLAAVKATPHAGDLLVYDGVHPNPAGHVVLAEAVLRGFGLSDDQIAKAREVWLDLPAGAQISVNVPLTLREYELLQPAATKAGQSVTDLVKANAAQSVKTLTAPPAAP